MPQLKTQQHKDTRRKMSENSHVGEEENAKYLNPKLNKNSHGRYDENGDFTVERDQNVSETFNYEKRVVEDGTTPAGAGVSGGAVDDRNIISRRPELDHVKNGGSLTSDRVNGARDLTPEHTYENVLYDLNGSKEILLHKFFRSTDGGDAVYANLCRGCGYGVFEAYGELCYFCASIVNGVRDTPLSIGSSSADHLDLVNNSSNVYENICENCYAIYSSDECVNCETDLKVKNDRTGCSNVATKVDLNAKSVKLGKSKSFNKQRSEKRSIFQGLIGSLKRSPKSTKSAKSNSATRLQIVHNVDGYENVFRTQETFDLQRICELKRTQTSSSEQHIYGRLKCVEVQNSQSNSASTHTLPLQVTELAKADSFSGYLNTASVTDSHCSLLNDVGDHNSPEINCRNTTKELNLKKLAAKAYKSGKRPRISKLRLLRADQKSTQESEKPKAAAQKQQQALYLPDSVCNWMTSLRREVHNYQSCFGDDETVGLCIPKSIPAKNSLLTYCSKARCGGVVDFGDFGDSVGIVSLNTIGAINDIPTLFNNELTNYTNIEVLKATTPIAVISHSNVTKSHSPKPLKSDNSSCKSNYDEVVTLRAKQENKATTIESSDDDNSPVEFDQMVNEFKRNLVAKQYKKQMSKNGNENLTSVVETTQHEHETGNKNNAEESIIKSKVNRVELESQDQLRQELRARRQAIYLRVDETKVNENHQNEKSKNNNGYIHNSIVVHIDSCLNNVKTHNSSENVSMHTAAALSELDSKDSTAESPVSRRRTAEAYVSSNGGTLNDNNRKRCGIYEPNVDSVFVSDILNDFDEFLQHAEDAIAANESRKGETEIQLQCTSTLADEQSNGPTITSASSSLSTLSHRQITPYAAAQQGQHNHLEGRKCSTPASIEQIFNFVKLNENLHLSRSLNNIIINYHQPLRAFLLAIRVRYPHVYKNYAQARLVRKYWRFHAFCVRKLSVKTRVRKRIKSCNENEKYDVILRRNQIENVSKTMAATDTFNGERNSVKIIVQQLELSCAQSISKSENQKLDSSCATNETYMTSVERTQAPIHKVKSNELSHKLHGAASKKPEPPQVPTRDPKTALSARRGDKTTPPLPIKRESLNNKMTIPTSNAKATQKGKQISTKSSDENIYQPIWKFKTVGEVQERYQTDADYYEIGVGCRGETTTGFDKQSDRSMAIAHSGNGDSFAPDVLASKDIEDHSEWETDDEFMFTTEMMSSDKVLANAQSSAEVNSINSSTVLNSPHTSSSLSGSTVAGFSSSTATLASAISASLTHHLFRNIGIFYSLTEPKLRAIIYDYDRVHASLYFAKRNIQNSEHLQTTSISPCSHDSIESNANDSGIGKSLKEDRLPTPPPRTTSATKSSTNIPKKFSESGCQSAKAPAEPLLPDSVQAWKFMLLDVNYIEDEEDMIVSETEILRSQEIKDDIDTRQTQQLNILQRFKSASFGNLVDLPNEDDKKSIAERMRNKLQRGVFKLNVRSPKSDKKNRGIFRRAEATSLYLEDGMKPKYPIFGAPLDQLELDQCTHHNVPRFVVDCVAYIERKDCIQQEGLYRASGNKVSIEELKQKLCESYIYDPKLLVIDDIHTLTSLLKLFFRELGAPLIPQETYERLGRNLSDAAAIDAMREAFDEMREPNRSTLKFLIRHLTNVAACSSENRMPASNLAIVWGPCIMSANQIEFDIGRMNTLAKVLIENYARIFNESERLVA